MERSDRMLGRAPGPQALPLQLAARVQEVATTQPTQTGLPAQFSGTAGPASSGCP